MNNLKINGVSLNSSALPKNIFPVTKGELHGSFREQVDTLSQTIGKNIPPIV